MAKLGRLVAGTNDRVRAAIAAGVPDAVRGWSIGQLRERLAQPDEVELRLAVLYAGPTGTDDDPSVRPSGSAAVRTRGGAGGEGNDGLLGSEQSELAAAGQPGTAAAASEWGSDPGLCRAAIRRCRRHRLRCGGACAGG